MSFEVTFIIVLLLIDLVIIGCNFSFPIKLYMSDSPGNKWFAFLSWFGIRTFNWLGVTLLVPKKSSATVFSIWLIGQWFQEVKSVGLLIWNAVV